MGGGRRGGERSRRRRKRLRSEGGREGASGGHDGSGERGEERIRYVESDFETNRVFSSTDEIRGVVYCFVICRGVVASSRSLGCLRRVAGRRVSGVLR